MPPSAKCQVFSVHCSVFSRPAALVPLQLLALSDYLHRSTYRYRVDYIGERAEAKEPTYTICVVGAHRDTLFTFASRVPERRWAECQDALREAATSFELFAF